MKKFGLVWIVGVCGLLFGVLMSVAIAMGLAAGSCIHWLVPAIDFGLATVVGELAFFCVASAGMIFLLGCSFWNSDVIAGDETENNNWSNEQAEFFVEQIHEAVQANLDQRFSSHGHPARRHARR